MADDKCGLIRGAAREFCERGSGGGGSGGKPDELTPEMPEALDPLGAAANWLSDQASALYRLMDKSMMAAADPLGGIKGGTLAKVYNPVAGLALLIGAVVLVGGLIFWIARPSGPAFKKAGSAGGRFFGLLFGVSVIPVAVVLIAFALGQFSALIYADLADHPFKGMETSLLGSRDNPYGRLAQAAVVLLSVGPLWLLCVIAPLAVLAAVVFLPLSAALGVGKGWMKSRSGKALLHLLAAVFLARVPVAITLMFRTVLPKGALTDLLLTAASTVVCLYILLSLPAMAKSVAAAVTRAPKLRTQSEGRTAVTKLPADTERQVHARRLAAAQAGPGKPKAPRQAASVHTPGRRPYPGGGKGVRAALKAPGRSPGSAQAADSGASRTTPQRQERIRDVRVPDVSARSAVRDRDAQAPPVPH
ncbi:hypothetical protein [Streptomyces kanamyceticus]|uniref:Uncharacterized protein n=1 Tax=Streptomyces kanamyceticus TaxID=1967 RepID=A0A5J6GFZ8_STRKN|nr:hypothetical protein [Streptomyces kanamyceticus]QEU92861.1 hypothetical protein CP970_19830 [Streptomyces kanamyceticus]